jgi:hypothetical protein
LRELRFVFPARRTFRELPVHSWKTFKLCHASCPCQMTASGLLDNLAVACLKTEVKSIQS